MTTMRTEQNKIQNVYRFWKMQLFDGCLRGAVSIGEVAGDKHRSAAAILQLYFVVAIICFGLSAVVVAKEGFVTATFGNAANVVYLRTLKIERELMHFDLSSLPKGTKIQRAILHVPFRSDWGGHSAVKLLPIGVSQQCLTTQPPSHRSLDATDAVSAWVAGDEVNRGLKIIQAGRAKLQEAVLEVSYLGPVAQPMPVVTQLKAEHHHGQTFLTWREPCDVVSRDEPYFEEFERAVLDAQAKRRIIYRVYRHGQPLTATNLGQAELVCEVQEALSCWNLLAIANTEHPQEGVTKRSSLRGGNLRLAHMMTRYRLSDDGSPLPRNTGLAVLTARQPGKHYYAVTVSVDGREAVDNLTSGQSLTDAVNEKPAKFPAIVYQRTRKLQRDRDIAPAVDVYVCWLEPPLVHMPRPVEIYIVHWPDLPVADLSRRLPLYVNLGTYGCSATEMSDPGWHAARRHVPGVVTVGLAEEGTLWAGDHECLGTLRGLDEGLVWNHEQRRVLAATAWAMEKPNIFIDPERIYVWGQFAGWALRHGDLFAAVMSNGHNNIKTSREGRKHYWRWGQPDYGRNWLGMNHLDYLDLAGWVRDNPNVELPYWVCWPAYGAFPDHSLGDFGFKPWQEFISAMKETRRAFAAVWMSNGPGLARGVCRDMVPQIKLNQSLPAFSNCSLDTSPQTDHPKGSYRPGRFDEDFQKYADKEGGINLYQRWDPNSIIDEPKTWAVTVWLARPNKQGEFGSPADLATMDITPRHCRKFKAEPGETLLWTNTSIQGGKTIASGEVTADRWGLVTVRHIEVNKVGNRIVIKRK
jgi:hypothetical protein